LVGHAATGAGVTYQWHKNGTPIPGATAAAYTVATAAPADAGSYTVTLTSGAATLTSPAAVITIEPPLAGRLMNLSVRTTAGTGAQTLIVGFAINGLVDKPILVRAIGPSLAQFGVTGALADPQLQLFAGSTPLTTNDNWATPAAGGVSASVAAAAFASAGAFPLDQNSKDAAIIRAMSPTGGPYSAQVTAATGAGGLALAELYDTDTTPLGVPTLLAIPRLVNVSARAQVGTGAGILIAGFSINGNQPKQILIRAIGPALAPFGVTGALANPKLELYRGSALVQDNNGWAGNADLAAAFTKVGAFALANPASRDSALLVTLEPGNYTAQVSGVNATTGVALVEIYEVP
jgi:hypothetical protein